MLKHQISTVPVFQTNDYDRFIFIKGNRPLNQAKITKIIADIEKGNDMLEYYPILVKLDESGEKLIILDGQHRYFIDKKLKRPVYYYIAKENKKMVEIATVNSNVEQWKPKDFINCYIHEGNGHYLELQKFIDTFGFSIGICLNLLFTGKPGKASGAMGVLHDQFKTGKFTIKESENAYTIAKEVQKFSEFANWRSRPFVLAIHKIIESNKVPVDDVVAAWNKNKSALTEQATFKDYLDKLEQIMNIGKKIRVIIH